ncbi:MAG TPA: Ig-like domain-containing protein [Chitinophagales bacterium]|nr:Ig-like domain-containing protein [Chitinophagales bacterium]
MKKNLLVAIPIVIALFSVMLPETVHATDINGSILVGGKTRTYFLHIPTGYDAAQSTPLVLVFHGINCTGSQMANITEFSPLADQENFIVVYPDGLNKKWATPKQNIDDVGFISALIDLLSTDYNIDQNRIFATGASNGGMLTYRLGMELTDRITAIAVVAGYMPSYSYNSTPVPTRPIGVMIFHGTTDPLIPYSEAEDAVNYWVDFDECSTLPLTMHLPNTDLLDGTTVDELTYTNGTNDTEVDLYKIYNGGHTWPGTDSHGTLGKVCEDINATEIIWDFFKNHSVNVSPTVSITNPISGFEYTVPASILIKATASDDDGTIKQVQFYNGINSLGVDTTAPYTSFWKNVPAGTYTIKVVATDNSGATSSDSITVIVNPLKTSLENVENNFIESYYDPSAQQLIITKTNALSEYDLSIYDSFGRKMFSIESIHDSKKIIPVSTFAQGTYIYCIKTKNMNTIGKLIITR